jgi:hypothetical protein
MMKRKLTLMAAAILVAVSAGTATADSMILDSYVAGQAAYEAFYSSLSPEEKQIENYMNEVFTNYRQETGDILAPTLENALDIMQQGGIPDEYREFVMSRMSAHARNQEAQQMLEKAQSDPNCWYLPENFKHQVGC